MKPFDSRLVKYAQAIRGMLAWGAVLGALKTLAILGWAWFLSQALTALIQGDTAALGGYVAGAAVSAILRSVVIWLIDWNSANGASRVKQELRSAALDRVEELGQGWLGGQSQAEVTVRVTRGLDTLDNYFSQYLPQLIMTVIATPVLVLVILLADPISGITVLVVFPVIPLFMIIIGMATQSVQDKQWSALTSLSRAFLDVVTGLPTLKIFGRERRQVGRIRALTEEYRARTMRVLRITFVSGFVLDLAGTFSVALVAVTIGTRLVSGEVALGLGLFVLLLVPEAFVPIRQVGASFHASAEGLSAAEDLFEILETEQKPATGSRRSTENSLEFDTVVVQHEGGPLIGPVDLRVAAGEIVALTGPSGIGESTVVSAALGLVPFSGCLGVPKNLAWAGQRPGLMAGTVLDNVTLGDDRPDPKMAQRALTAADAGQIDPRLMLGPGGSGLSGGQSQRVAIARCLYRAWSTDAGALLLDEPTSALDSVSEARVLTALRAEADAGRAVLIITHREALRDGADRIIALQREGITL